jgi:hypothetical protein
MPSATHSNLRLVNVLHGIQFLVGSGVLGIGIYMMFFAKPRPRSNSGRWALSVVSHQPRCPVITQLTDCQAAKSLVIIAYQVLTTNVKACQRWASLKAYLILDVLEIVFWIAAVVLTVMGMTKLCAGVSCILSGVTVGLAVFLTYVLPRQIRAKAK